MRIQFSLVLAGMALALHGCGVVHLHDQVKATASKDASDEYAKIDLQMGVKTRQSNFTTLEADYVAAVENRWAAQRDLTLVKAVNNELNLRDLVLGDTFGFDRIRKGFGIDSRAKLDELIKAVRKYSLALPDYEKSQNEFKRTFARETRKLTNSLSCLRLKGATPDLCRLTLKKTRLAEISICLGTGGASSLCSQCLSKTDKELKGCEKIADAIKKGDSRDRAESDPQLPAPLVTIAFRPTPCLSEQVPAPSTPNYLKYGMASRPDGVPGAENERVGQIIAAMNEGYNSFNNAIESAYCRKNSGEKCVEGSVEKRISHFAEVCRNRVLHNLGLIENFSPRPSNKGQNKKSDIEDAFPTGRKLVEDLKAAMRDAESFRVELEKQRKALDDAIKKYNANASTLGIAQKKKKEGEEDKEELKETLEDIRKAIDAANGIGGAVGIEIASEQQLKAIDGLIEAIAEGQVDAAKFGDNEKLKRFATVASTIRSLQKQFDEASVKQAELQLSVLLTQRRIQEARRNWARKRVEIQQKRIELYSSRLTTLAGREAKKSEPRSVLAFYESAFTRLNRAVLGDNHGGFDLVKDQESADKNKWESESRSIQAILGEMRTASVSEDQADDLAQGLVDLATANQVLKSNAETVAIKLEMLKGQEVLAKNEMSLMMWDAIIRQPLVLVAAYHQAGVKPEELAKLFILASGFISVGATN